MSDDGISISSTAHPVERGWWRLVRFWLHDLRVRLFGFRGVVDVEIEIPEAGEARPLRAMLIKPSSALNDTHSNSRPDP